MTTRCRRTDDGYRLPSHLPDCRDRGCPGCEPCVHDDHGYPVRHCTARRHCTSHLDADHPLTCPSCIGKTRGDLDAIETLAALMPEEATETGVDSQAAMLAGPAADPEAWTWRKIAARQGRAWHVSLIEDDDEHHPLTVLGTWDRMLREDYGHVTAATLTLTTAAGYLRWLLTDLAQDEDQDWPLFAREIAACRAHLEAVLHDSRAPETGAPCPDCTTEDKRGPALVRRYVDHDTTGASDYWRCPADSAHNRSEADYRLRVAGDYLATADRLTASQMAEAHGIKPGSLTGWATKGHVRKRGRDQHGRQLYDVADARQMAGLEVVGA